MPTTISDPRVNRYAAPPITVPTPNVDPMARIRESLGSGPISGAGMPAPVIPSWAPGGEISALPTRNPGVAAGGAPPERRTLSGPAAAPAPARGGRVREAMGRPGAFGAVSDFAAGISTPVDRMTGGAGAFAAGFAAAIGNAQNRRAGQAEAEAAAEERTYQRGRDAIGDERNAANDARAAARDTAELEKAKLESAALRRASEAGLSSADYASLDDLWAATYNSTLDSLRKPVPFGGVAPPVSSDDLAAARFAAEAAVNASTARRRPPTPSGGRLDAAPAPVERAGTDGQMNVPAAGPAAPAADMTGLVGAGTTASPYIFMDINDSRIDRLPEGSVVKIGDKWYTR